MLVESREFLWLSHYVQHLRSLGICCWVRPVLMLNKEREFSCNYQSSLEHYERSKMLQADK